MRHYDARWDQPLRRKAAVAAVAQVAVVEGEEEKQVQRQLMCKRDPW
jgi:hypothetical protein